MASSALAIIVPIRIQANLERILREGASSILLAVERFLEITVFSLTALEPVRAGDVLDRELELHRRVARDCVDPIFATVLQNAHQCLSVAGESERIARQDGFVPQRSQVKVQVSLLGGSIVSLNTPYFLRRRSKKRRPGRPSKPVRGQSGNGVYPILALLGIHYRISPALGSEVARLVAQGTQRDALENLAVRGVELKLKVIQRLVRDFASRALAYREWCQSLATPRKPTINLKGKRIAIAMDGGRIRLRETNSRGRRRKSGRRGFKAEWREPKLLVIYELDENGRRKAGGLLRYEATLGDADRICDLLVGLLKELGAQEADEWVLLGDGAPWLWNRFGELAKTLAYDPAKVTQILDYYHAVEHLQSIADAVKGWKSAERRSWMHLNKKLLQKGDTDSLLVNCELLCKGRNAKKIRKLLGYFRDHTRRMQYAKFKARRLPIGSGAVESGIRRVVNLRLKGNGIFWTRATAEGVLHLRAQLLSGRWTTFVKAILEPTLLW